MNTIIYPSVFTSAIVILSQVTTPPEGLLVYGPMGIMLAWFMWRFEGLLKEIRTLSHRFDGMTRAMLVDVIDRDNASPTAKKIASDMLTKIMQRDS